MSLPFEPRPGQWLKFKVSADKVPALTSMDAFVTPDGYLLGVFVRAGRSAVTTVTKPNGEKVTEGGEMLPARIMLVDENGHNIPSIKKDKATGHAEVANVYFSPEAVQDLRPLDDLDHLPPGYEPAEGWEPPEVKARLARQSGPPRGTPGTPPKTPPPPPVKK